MLGALGAVSFSGCSPKESVSEVSSGGKVPVVPVVKARKETLVRDLTFDAEFRPFQDIDLHAHVAGFVQIGRAHV